MEKIEAAKSSAYKSLPRQRAEQLVKDACAEWDLEPKRHPVLEKIEGLREFAGVVLLNEFNADQEYENVLPWFRATDRAREHVISQFESQYGRFPEGLRKTALDAIGKSAHWWGLSARDEKGNKWFVPVAGEPLREVRLSAAQAEAYERARKGGKLSAVPTL